jgi:uncharacterized membrane protein HdeD (DUF308 family)
MVIQPGTDDGLLTSASIRKRIHDHWGMFLAEGIILVLLGLIAMTIPLFAGLAATIFLGWLFLVAGGIGLAFTFGARHAPGFFWSLLSSFVALVAGLLLVLHPLQGLVTLTIVLAAYFLVDGILVIAQALAHRQELSGRWEWMLVNGIIDLVLAGLIFTGMPGSFVWVLGLLLGVDLLFGGASLIAIALGARSEVQR